MINSGWFSFPRIAFIAVSAVAIGLIIFFIARGVATWVKNNNSPVETRHARAVSKRVKKSSGMTPTGTDGGFITTVNETFYMTFQLDGNETAEFKVRRSVYKAHNEGEPGDLTYRGTRFISFE